MYYYSIHRICDPRFAPPSPQLEHSFLPKQISIGNFGGVVCTACSINMQIHIHVLLLLCIYIKYLTPASPLFQAGALFLSKRRGIGKSGVTRDLNSNRFIDLNQSQSQSASWLCFPLFCSSSTPFLKTRKHWEFQRRNPPICTAFYMYIYIHIYSCIITLIHVYMMSTHPPPRAQLEHSFSQNEEALGISEKKSADLRGMFTNMFRYRNRSKLESIYRFISISISAYYLIVYRCTSILISVNCLTVYRWISVSLSVNCLIVYRCISVSISVYDRIVYRRISISISVHYLSAHFAFL